MYAGKALFVQVKIRPESIQAARKRLGLSQDRFAQAFGVSASTLRKWEQGQREPTGAAKTLLRFIEREPKAVLRALEVLECPGFGEHLRGRRIRVEPCRRY